MSALPAAVGAVGAATVGVTAALCSKEKKLTPALAVGGLAGTALLLAGCWRRHVPRGKRNCDLDRQTKFDAQSGCWSEAKDEDGQPVQIHLGEKGTVALPADGDPSKHVRDSNGLYMSSRPEVRTTYDIVFATDRFDDRPALGRCTKQHTFKDATLPNGKANPKPTVVDAPGQWEFLTYADMKLQARAFGTCMRKVHGIARGEKIAIWSTNSVEWMLTDLACVAFSWTSVSVYDTLGPDAASYIVGDSGAKVLVCEDKTFKRVPALLDDEVYKGNPGADLKVIVYLGKGDAKTQSELEKRGLTVMDFHAAVAEHKGALEKDTPPSKDDIVTIMYTSGTTGAPKGVKLKHENIVSVITGATELSQAIKLYSTDVYLSFLPLAHIFERQNVMGLFSQGAVVNFASNSAKALLADLAVIRPTLFVGVPKVYENVRDAVNRKMHGLKKKLFDAALKAKSADIQSGCGYSPLWDILIFGQTKKALGGRVRFCVTGGAPISKETLQFVICALGPVVQGYGATETSAASTLSMPFDLAVGHVGAPMLNTFARLVDVPDMNYFTGPAAQYTNPKAVKVFSSNRNKNGGEVWIGGPGVSPGYYDPSVDGLRPGVPSNGMAKKTAEDFFQADGWSWFKTGDIGAWDERGTLRIVDRKKNMFKTSLGEYVPVEEVEKAYQDNCEFADFVFLPKETKVAYVALCVIVSDSIKGVMRWAQESGVPGGEAEVVSSEAFRKMLFDKFQEVAQAKKLQRFMWIQSVKNIYTEYQPAGYQEDWVTGVECSNGHKEQLLTATFKARRAQLDQYFAPAFPKMYPDRPPDHTLP